MGFSTIRGFAFFAPYMNLPWENCGHFKSFVLLSNNTLPCVDICGRQAFSLLVPETLSLEQNLSWKSDL